MGTVIGKFNIARKVMAVKMTEDEDGVTLFVTEEGSDVPMSRSQVTISKKTLSVVDSHEKV